jgi:hypothetical protein
MASEKVNNTLSWRNQARSNADASWRANCVLTGLPGGEVMWLRANLRLMGEKDDDEKTQIAVALFH